MAQPHRTRDDSPIPSSSPQGLPSEDLGAKDSSLAENGDRADGEAMKANGAIQQLPSPLPTPTDKSSISPTSPTTPRDPMHDLGSGESSQDQSTDDTSSDSAVSNPTASGAVKDSSGENTVQRSRTSSSVAKAAHPDGVRRLSASRMTELTGSLPIAAIPDRDLRDHPLTAGLAESTGCSAMAEPARSRAHTTLAGPEPSRVDGTQSQARRPSRPPGSSRTLSTPPISRRKSSSQPPTQSTSARRNSFHPAPRPPPLNLEGTTDLLSANSRTAQTPRLDPNEPRPPSPLPAAIPLPPMSIPTILQLELAGQRPSPLYIHHSYTSEIPYESSAVKFERLKNFLLLPTFLERTMNFGVLACLDAWLWTLTILPMRFCIALGVLLRWWAYVVGKEARWMTGFVWEGLGRMWQRGRRGRASSRSSNPGSASEDSRSRSRLREASSKGILPNGNTVTGGLATAENQPPRRQDATRTNGHSSAHVPRAAHSRSQQHPARERRTKSMPSNLTSFHKADLLQGAVIICSSLALMNLDASRMYHFIRAQSAVKLYVIYNLIEVGDRLLSALGQDVFECLFSSETLSRNASGRSKIMLPFGMFLLSLVYNIAHSVVLFYQVITLNVAVNSYSNALLSLLMSNQFVEVKSSVFKRTEKENTFQLACADIVERFQLWVVLFIIGMRNIVEIGGLSVPGAGIGLSVDDLPVKIPLHNSSILPASFTILPSWLASGEVLSPFLIVIGSEMIVDWIKHAYINKFNNIKPNFYSRMLDILCKDYYTNAFVAPALIRRLGLPLLPLCTLFIRASVQTYHMFLATHLPSPLPPSAQTSLSVESASPSSPAMAASLDRLDTLIRNALGRAVYGNPYNSTAGGAVTKLGPWTSDDLIAGLTMVVVFFITFLVLLVVKLLLGMALLRYSRNRYVRMKAEERAVAAGLAEAENFDAKGKRVGSYGKVEVGEDRRRWLFHDDPEGLKKLREKERRESGKGKKEIDLNTITRYEMSAKRIW